MPVSLTEEDSGCEIAMQLGDEVGVVLPENPTTGYRWVLARAASGILELQKSSFEPATGAGVGRGGNRTFTFHAVAAGRFVLELERRRSWDPAATPSATFRCTVIVR